MDKDHLTMMALISLVGTEVSDKLVFSILVWFFLALIMVDYVLDYLVWRERKQI